MQIITQNKLKEFNNSFIGKNLIFKHYMKVPTYLLCKDIYIHLLYLNHIFFN